MFMKYDVIVIGAGSAGLNIASFMNKIKLKVLLVEKRKIGGDCLNYGCVPSKALISLSHVVKNATLAKKLGLKVNGKVDMVKISKEIKKRQNVIREHENADYFRKQGIDVVLGGAKFISKDTIEVNEEQFIGKNIVIATGSRPNIPEIKSIKNVKVFTNETIFENTKLPKKLIVIGGGPIGVELGQAYHNLGSKVTIITRSNRILPKDDIELSKMLFEYLQGEGIVIYTETDFKGFHENKFVCGLKNGKSLNVPYDAVIVAIGRRLNVEGLDLEKAGIEVKNHRIVVDETLRTTNKKVYVCGDVAGEFQFTHWAEYQAGIVINNMLNVFKKKTNKKKIAWVTYTNPELASFGVIDDKDAKIISSDVGDVDRAIAEGMQIGKLKLHIKNKKIIGGSLLAKNAGEIIRELILAMELGINANRLFDQIYPYPTLSRINRKAIQKQLGEKLTDRNISILGFMFRILNR